MPRPPPAQSSLFETAPSGFVQVAEFLSSDEEASLVADIGTLTFSPFEFHGWQGRRETVSFGFRYDFNNSQLEDAPPIPDFLGPLRVRAARLAGLDEHALVQATVIRYGNGAGIGWHRDRPMFEKVVGISLLAPCVLRFRQRTQRDFERFPARLAGRSAYLLEGEIRDSWEHSIAPMQALRYAITFRSRRVTPLPRQTLSSRAAE